MGVNLKKVNRYLEFVTERYLQGSRKIQEKQKSLPFHGLLSPTAPKGSMPISANMTGDEGNWKIV